MSLITSLLELRTNQNYTIKIFKYIIFLETTNGAADEIYAEVQEPIEAEEQISNYLCYRAKRSLFNYEKMVIVKVFSK